MKRRDAETQRRREQQWFLFVSASLRFNKPCVLPRLYSSKGCLHSLLAPARLHGFALDFGLSQRLERDEALPCAHHAVANTLEFAFALFAAAFVAPVCFVNGWH